MLGILGKQRRLADGGACCEIASPRAPWRRRIAGDGVEARLGVGESATVELRGGNLVRTLGARRTSELIELDRLDDAEVAEMLDSCLGAEGASPELVALAARADGVPFLVEELLAVAVASGALVDRGTSWTLSGTVDHVVPLCAGGSDSVGNLQWQLKADAQRKDVAEKQLCARIRQDIAAFRKRFPPATVTP